MAIVGIVGFLFDFPSGVISDIYGRKKIASLGFILWAIGFVLFSFAENYFSFLGVAIIMSIATAMISGAPISWCIESLKEQGSEEKEINMMIQKGKMIVKVGNISAAILGSVFASFNIRLGLIICAVISGLTGVIALIFKHDNKGIHEGGIKRNLIKLVRDFFHSKQLVMILIFMIFEIIPFQLFIMSWQILVTDTLKMSVTFIGTFLAIFMVSQFLGNFVSSKLIKKYEVKQLVVFGMSLSLGGFVIMTASIYAKFAVGFLIGAILYEFGLSIEQVNGFCMSQNVIDSDSRATFTSAISAILSFSCFFINIILGILIQNMKYEIVYIVIIMVYVLALIYFKKKLGKSESMKKSL